MANPTSPWNPRERGGAQKSSLMYELFLEIEPAVKAYAIVLGRWAQSRLAMIGNSDPELEYQNLIGHAFQKLLARGKNDYTCAEDLQNDLTWRIKGQVRNIMRLAKSRTPHLAIDNSPDPKPYTMKPEDGRLVADSRPDATVTEGDFIAYVERRDPTLIPLLREKLAGNLKPQVLADELEIPVTIVYLMNTQLRKLGEEYGLLPPRKLGRNANRSSEKIQPVSNSTPEQQEKEVKS